MSIRQSPEITPQLLDAARANGRRSHGPSTAAGKQNCRMNALKHGERSDPENQDAVMLALGEDPARFETLKQELRESFGSGDPFVEKQVDDLARLYLRRDRIERAQTGLMRRALLEVEERQHRRRKEIEGATIAAGEAIDVRLEAPSDPAARLRLLLSLLGRKQRAWTLAPITPSKESSRRRRSKAATGERAAGGRGASVICCRFSPTRTSRRAWWRRRVSPPASPANPPRSFGTKNCCGCSRQKRRAWRKSSNSSRK